MTDPERTYLMTGASRGIGRHAAVRLLTDDPAAHLIVTARAGDGPALAGTLRAESGNPHVTAVAADLGSLAAIRAAAAEVGQLLDSGRVPPLAGLLGNAGLQRPDARTASVDGIELTFAVNVLANHLLVRLLADRLRPAARIVLTTSDTHFGDLRHNLGLVPAPVWRHPLELARPGTGPRPGTVAGGRTAYSTSKLGVIYLVHELARRLPATDVYAWNPGFVPATGLARDAGAGARFAMRRVLPLLTLTPLSVDARTAGRMLAATVTGPPPAPSGSYLDREAPQRSSAESYDPAREHELWAAADRLCGLDGSR
jgi:NAD(P)-dependent dehydrogenase (short-subunit alcohol dehydrogenase family)